MTVASNGRVDAREIAELGRLDAFQRLGIGRPDLLALAHQEIIDVGAQLADHGSLRPEDHARLHGWLAEIDDPGRQLLLCRLASAVVRADGRISLGERWLCRTMLDRWQLTPMMVAHAIMRDPGPSH